MSAPPLLLLSSSLLSISLAAAGCGDELALGSDLLWTARFEGGTLDEWTGVPGGASQAFPAGSTVEVSTERAHGGASAARLSITARADGPRPTAALARAGDLPVEAYYSAWYYLPRAVDVGTYWVIFKLRRREVADDPASAAELYDLNLANFSGDGGGAGGGGGMTVRLYDHRTAADLPLEVAAPAVPVATWFQLEAYYRNTQDATARLTFWLDGRRIIDRAGPDVGAPTRWVEWNVISTAESLTPSAAALDVDDCAISRTRVGPQGLLDRSR